MKLHPQDRFVLELAERLKMTKAELMERMSAYEMQEWAALYELRAEEGDGG